MNSKTCLITHATMVQYYSIPDIRRIPPVAQDRELWKELCYKLLFQPVGVRFFAARSVYERHCAREKNNTYHIIAYAYLNTSHSDYIPNPPSVILYHINLGKL